MSIFHQRRINAPIHNAFPAPAKKLRSNLGEEGDGDDGVNGSHQAARFQQFRGRQSAHKKVLSLGTMQWSVACCDRESRVERTRIHKFPSKLAHTSPKNRKCVEHGHNRLGECAHDLTKRGNPVNVPSGQEQLVMNRSQPVETPAFIYPHLCACERE